MSACSSSVNVFDNTSLHGVQNPLSKLCLIPGAGCAQQKEPKMRPKKKNLSSVGKAEAAGAGGVRSTLLLLEPPCNSSNRSDVEGVIISFEFVLIKGPFSHQKENHTQAALADTKIQQVLQPSSWDLLTQLDTTQPPTFL